MNLDQDLILAYLEEDNIQRAYFRVRPLLTVHGDVREDAVKLWPDEGCLRIVPDRAEQHTFKDRMRTLGSYCVVDLRGIPSDAGKIRTNKNYRPERGEINQYILYSDTVHALPEHTFFEIIEGTTNQAAEFAAQAITPLYYIRQEDTLFGPVSKADPQPPQPAAQAAGTLFTIDAPDQKQHLILCMEVPAANMPETPAPKVEPEETAAPVPEPAKAESPVENKPDDETLPVGKKLTILDENKSFDETIQSLDQPLSKGANLLHIHESKPVPAPRMPQANLSGTPLYHAPLKTSVPQPKNKLQEVIASQLRVARYEPPTASLPAGTAMRQVHNPVESACYSLKEAWQVPEAQTQLMEFVLSLDGMRAKLETKLTPAGADTPLQKVLQNRLQDLEAERLAALIQLDQAKSDLEGFRKSTMEALQSRNRAEATRMAEEKTQYDAAIEELKRQLASLTAQRAEMQARVDDLQQSALPAALAKAMTDAQLNAPVNGIPLRMSCTPATDTSAEEIIARVSKVFADTGAELDRNEIIALLMLLAVSPRFGLTCTAPAVAATVMSNLAAALGWQDSYAQQVSPEQRPLLTKASVNATPAVLLTALPNFAPLPSITKVMVARAATHLVRNPAYDIASWPIMPLRVTHSVAQADIAGQPTTLQSLKTLAAKSEISPEQLREVLKDLAAQTAPMSGATLKEMSTFISGCAALMDGGLVAACDWAILLWYLPALERTPKVINALKPLLQEYPLSLTRLTL